MTLTKVLASTEQCGYRFCSITQINNCLRLKPGTSRSQVEHTTIEPMGKLGMLSGVGSYHIGDKSMLRLARMCVHSN